MIFGLFPKKPKALEFRFFVIDCNDGTKILEHIPGDSLPRNASSYPGGKGMPWHERDACITRLQVGVAA